MLRGTKWNGQMHLYKISKRVSRPVGALAMSSVNFDQDKICTRFDALFCDPTQASGLATIDFCLILHFWMFDLRSDRVISREQQPRTALLLNLITLRVMEQACFTEEILHLFFYFTFNLCFLRTNKFAMYIQKATSLVNIYTYDFF